MRYPGGKGKCFQQLINLMPPHETYIEAYLGGGSVLRNKKPALRSIGIDIDESVIRRWRAQNDHDLELVHGDAISFMENFEFTGRELVYIDPPYLPSTRRKARVYRHDYSEDQHEKLLRMVKTLRCMVMISGYGSSLYDNQLNGWSKISFQANSQVGLREECVWFNFEAPEALHDARHLGSNFRERQTIKRRRERLYERIEGLDPIERHELMAWMSAKYGEARTQ